MEGDAVCELEEASLLQARMTKATAVAKEDDRWGVLGRGHWVAKEDFWSMHSLESVSLFKWEFPADCFEEAQCGAASGFQQNSFSSVRSWASHFGKSFGLDIGGSYEGFSGSVSSSVGSDVYGKGHVIDEISYVRRTSVRKCKHLIRTKRCALNKDLVVPDLINWIENLLPIGRPFTAERMLQWERLFIQKYGTHYTIASIHGAMVQAISNSHSSSSVSKKCLDSSLCGNFGFVNPETVVVDPNGTAGGAASLAFCSSANECTSKEHANQAASQSCVAKGGQINLQSKVCGSSISADDLESFLDGGELDSGSSVIRFTFKPIAEFLTNLDPNYLKAALTLTMAVEFANCRIREGIQSWSEDHGCQCSRECQNGGTLDTTDCSCSCRKDDKHGWTGPTCGQTFGSCQSGTGSGNPDASDSCKDGNQCASAVDKHHCKPTDVCCATDLNTKCCPFGSVCNCGAFSCDCS